MISTAAPFVLGLSKVEWRVFSRLQGCITAGQL
jgi:hypothetical protein